MIAWPSLFCSDLVYILVMPKRGKEKGATKKTFCLLRWIEDETVSVLPTTAAKAGQKVYPGVYCEFKWLKNVYEAEVLKVSGKIIIIIQCLGLDQSRMFVARVHEL